MNRERGIKRGIPAVLALLVVLAGCLVISMTNIDIQAESSQVESDPIGSDTEELQSDLGFIHVFSDSEDESHADSVTPPESNDISEDNDVSPQVIIGSDDRTKVTNTRLFPYSAIALIKVVYEDNEIHNLTGFFISPNTVITNAHGIFNPDTSAWARRVEVSPGFSNGEKVLGSATATMAVIHPEYWNTINVVDSFDLAVIRLNKNFGSEVGNLSFSTSVSLNQKVTSIGYHNDKGGASQYRSPGKILGVTNYLVDFDCDTYRRSSGSPVLDSGNRVVAVNYGGSTRINSGVRMNSQFINWINRIKDSSLPVYRVYNPNTGEHFYTVDQQEKNSLVRIGWTDEGTAWSTSYSGQAIYRLYNPNGSEHHYTSNAAERDALTRIGWSYEKVAWYAPTKDAYPIYRLYNPNKKHNNHHYTISKKERDDLLNMGWNNEGTAWLGY